MGSFWWNGIEHYDDISNDKTYGATSLCFGFASSLRLLFSFENQLRFGFGTDLAFGVQVDVSSRNGGQTNNSIIEFLAPVAIMGYKSVYLHAGYDFVLGALYLAPCLIIKDHLMLGIPLSLFGSNQRFSIVSLFMPPERYNASKDLYYNFENRMFRIGFSVQYVF